jgi:polyisoprenoid-binding protein YceI
MKQLIVVLLSIVASQVLAATWGADKVHSHIGFTATHLLIAEVQGKFTDYEVTFNAEKDDFTDARVEAIIRTASIFTDNEKRDNHLRADDFLAVEQYPEGRFVSREFEKAGGNEYRIHGDLTLRGVTLPVTLNAVHKGTIEDSRMGTRAGFKATAVINRFDYGIKWNAVMETGGLIVGEQIEITILLELVKQ